MTTWSVFQNQVTYAVLTFDHKVNSYILITFDCGNFLVPKVVSPWPDQIDCSDVLELLYFLTSNCCSLLLLMDLLLILYFIHIMNLLSILLVCNVILESQPNCHISISKNTNFVSLIA